MIFAVILFCLWLEGTVDRTSLKQVSGRLTAFDFPPMGKGAPRGLRVFLEDKSDGNKLYVADQAICSDRFPSLRTLKVGDQITALMQTHALSATSSLWELKRGSETLLSYDQVRLGAGQGAALLLCDLFCAMAAVACLAAGLRARRRAGAWT